MKLLDKLKNALFEEEYVEVEEKKEVKKKEKPIAKKIVADDTKIKKHTHKDDLIVEEEKKVPSKENANNEFKFKAILDDDFIDIEKEKKTVSEKKIEPKPPQGVKSKPIYQQEVKKETKKPYKGVENEFKIHEYGAMSARAKEKKNFHPSPIISPIYGVLNQNYNSDDIVQKKEIRTTSSFKSRNIDVDSVREKAYGNNDDIFEEELKSSKDNFKEEKYEEDVQDNLLDISSDNTPSVSKVTMKDAEEYYSDLGLEYNIDYKDVSLEKATGRRTNLKDFESDDDLDEENYDNSSIEDNLFDLIDSMYDEKKGE